MKKSRLIVLISFCIGMLINISCSGHKQERSTDKGEASLIEVKIEGMSCTGCEQTIQRNVAKLEGIKSVKATFTDGRAVIEYFPGTVDSLKIKDAITGSGYKVIKCSNIQPVEAAK